MSPAIHFWGVRWNILHYNVLQKSYLNRLHVINVLFTNHAPFLRSKIYSKSSKWEKQTQKKPLLLWP